MPVGRVQSPEQCFDDVLLVLGEESACNSLFSNVPVVGDVHPQQTAIILVIPVEADFFLLRGCQRIKQLLDERLRSRLGRLISACNSRQQRCSGNRHTRSLHKASTRYEIVIERITIGAMVHDGLLRTTECMSTNGFQYAASLQKCKRPHRELRLEDLSST